MAEGNTENGNKGLVATLGALGVIVVGLIIAIVVVSVNRGGQVAVDEPDAEPVQTEEEILRMSTNMTDEELAVYNEFAKVYDSVMVKAQELASKEDVTAEEIVDLYTPVIDTYMQKGDYGNAQPFISARTSDLISRGFKREALDSLMSVDYSIFPPYVQNRYYKRIIKLAQELGDTESVAKYEVLANETESAAEAAKAATRENAEEMQKEMEEMAQ